MQFARNALVAGGTGLVGTELLKLLAEERRYGRITSLVRRETVSAGRVDNRVVSFDDLDRSELPGVDDAYATGANVESRFLYTRVKGQVEAAVTALGFHVVGVVRPSFLIGRRAKARGRETAAIVLSRAITPIMVGPLRRFRPIEARTVAAGLIHLAFNAPKGVSVLSSEKIVSALQSAHVDEALAVLDTFQANNFEQSN